MNREDGMQMMAFATEVPQYRMKQSISRQVLLLAHVRSFAFASIICIFFRSLSLAHVSERVSEFEFSLKKFAFRHTNHYSIC